MSGWEDEFLEEEPGTSSPAVEPPKQEILPPVQKPSKRPPTPSTIRTPKFDPEELKQSIEELKNLITNQKKEEISFQKFTEDNIIDMIKKYDYRMGNVFDKKFRAYTRKLAIHLNAEFNL
jgi:hypothetical protein